MEKEGKHLIEESGGKGGKGQALVGESGIAIASCNMFATPHCSLG